MKNHSCPFSNHCSYYDDDSCQGCNYAKNVKPTEIKPKFKPGDIVRVKGCTGAAECLNGHTDVVRDGFRLGGTYAYHLMDSNHVFTEEKLESEQSAYRIDRARAQFASAVTAYDAHIRREAAVPKSTISKIVEEMKMRNNIDKSKPGWSIKQVIFNDPATIVFWQDGSKTVVKCENEVFDPEKGLAMALSKKMLGNQSNYFNVFKKWLPADYETPRAKQETKPWLIWYRELDSDGNVVGSGVHITTYKRKNDATRVARQRYGDASRFQFIVSMANPWGGGVGSC